MNGPKMKTFDLAQTLNHCEQVVRSKIGAGNRLSKAFHSERWERHFADAGVVNAPVFTQSCYAALVVTVHDDDMPPQRLASSAMAFAYIRAMSSEWAVLVSPQASAGKHMVYQLFNDHGGLLYVGITDRGPTRLAEHYRHKPWFPQVVRVEFERYASRAESSAREIELITSLRPLHNIQHNVSAR